MHTVREGVGPEARMEASHRPLGQRVEVEGEKGRGKGVGRRA